MATYNSDHGSIYFDKLCRTKKAESVLSMIMATYQAKIYGHGTKQEIAENLVDTYRIYKGTAGTYSGDLVQFSKQYTIGLELGIWKNSNLDLSDYAILVAENRITIREYFDRFFLNFIEPVNGHLVHILYHCLEYMVRNHKTTLSKTCMEQVFREVTDLQSPKDIGDINGTYNMLLGTNYFTVNTQNDPLVYSYKMQMEELLSLCNTKYLDAGYEAAENELSDSDVYLKYLFSSPSPKVEQEPTQEQEKEKIYPEIKLPHNRIIFGAPGTGKSFRLEEQRIENFGENYERVTFHPNYTYSQFVGTYKPVKNNTDDNITYEFIPGPFIRIFLKAYFDQKMSFNIQDERIFILPNNKDKSGWDYYKEVTGPGFEIDWWNPHSEARIGDIVLLYLGSSYEKRGVFAIGKIISEPFDVPEENGKRIKIKLDYTSFDEPFFTEEQINEKQPGRHIQSWINETEHAKDLLNNYSKGHNYLLLIEEINRAKVAAVFGDVFQLLDRNKSNISEYPINISEDLKNFFLENGIELDKLYIPSNMYIWATMNSADQGVYPLDTAFKRRWEFEYIGINENQKDVLQYEIPLKEDNSEKVNWNDFRTKLNNKLSSDLRVNEDKLLGPFFLSEETLKNATANPKTFIKAFESKVLMYLFEDVVKINPTELFNNISPMTFSNICKEFESRGLDIFNF